MKFLSKKEFLTRLNEILQEHSFTIPEGKSFNGTGGPGRLLEHLFGVDENNHDGPDTGYWELKFHGGTAPITLLHLSPLPAGGMKKIVEKYGWLDEQGRTSFRHTIWGATDLGFQIVNEDEAIKVVNHLDPLPEVPYWPHDKLENAFTFKLRRLAVVRGRKLNGTVHFDTACLYEDPTTKRFIDCVTSGIIAVDFDARTQIGKKGLRDHGTKFRIKIDNLDKLYSKTTPILVSR